MSEKHNHLIETAIVWLRDNGYDDIELEVKVLNGSGYNYKRHYKDKNRIPTMRQAYYAIDIVGRNGNKKIAIECGGSKSAKLDNLLRQFKEVWVLPYGEIAPYKWQEGEIACSDCGHII